MNEYDYAIVGGGCAGLSLAYHLAQHPTLRHRRVLLIEPQPKDQNDRTWCFWTATDDDPCAPFAGVVAHHWPTMVFRTDEQHRRQSAAPYQYRMIRGLDFYQFVRRRLADLPNFHLHRAPVTNLTTTPTGVVVTTSQATFTADYVFNSGWRSTDQAPPAGPSPYVHLNQHFVGWEVETDAPAFDPSAMHFMDFRTPQSGQARFFYLLPFNAHRALVEFTVFSPQVLSENEYATALRTYLHDTLDLRDYRVLATEAGVIPMTDQPFAAGHGPRIVNLGTLGGQTKPSTGYTFVRIQRHAARLVAALAATGVPPPSTPAASRFRFYDRLLLHILARRGHLAQPIFARLFATSSLPQILRFLDERTRPAEEARLLALLPWHHFLRAAWAVYIQPRWRSFWRVSWLRKPPISVARSVVAGK